MCLFFIGASVPPRAGLSYLAANAAHFPSTLGLGLLM